MDASQAPRVVDDYTRVERLLVAYGPPRGAGTTLALAIENLLRDVRREERQRSAAATAVVGSDVLIGKIQQVTERWWRGKLSSDLAAFEIWNLFVAAMPRELSTAEVIAALHTPGAVRLEEPMSEDDTKRGLYAKYEVRRLDDPSGKHNECDYFVLDPKHDKFAKAALQAYADAAEAEYPLLADNLRRRHKLEPGRAAAMVCSTNEEGKDT